MDKVSLIICDIDGTLVDSQRHLSAKTREILKRVNEKGILFGIASGRPVDELKRFNELWQLDFPFDIVIGMNGSELWDEQNQSFSSFYKLKKEWIKDIVEFMAPFDLNPFIYEGDHMLALRLDEMMQGTSARNSKPVKIAKDLSDFYKEDNAKVLYRMSIDIIDEVERYAKAHITGEYKVFKTQPIMIEFAHAKTDKANALLHYCKEHNLPLNEVVAFGDASNDDGMLKVAGKGIVPKNAISTTKEIADIVLERSNDEDAVAYYIAENIL